MGDGSFVFYGIVRMIYFSLYEFAYLDDIAPADIRLYIFHERSRFLSYPFPF